MECILSPQQRWRTAWSRSTDGKNFTTLATFSKHNAAFSDVTVSAGVPFWYRVIALGGGGKESAPSNIAGVTTLSTPRNFAVSNASTSQVGLIWDKVSTALNYQVQRFDGTTWTPLVKLGKTTLAFVDTTSASGTDYSYRVGATSASGSSSYATLQLTTPMEVPSVTADSSVAGQVTITWDSVNGAIGGYEVDRKAAGQVFGQLAIVKDATEYQDLAVTEDADYEYQVIAIGSADSSSASDVVQTHTAVAAPTDCAAQVLSGSQVNVRWTHALADSYISIEGSIDGGQTWDVMIMVPGDFSEIVVTTKGSKTYQFRLQTRAFDGLNSGYAEIHDVVTPLASPAISALATDSGVTMGTTPVMMRVMSFSVRLGMAISSHLLRLKRMDHAVFRRRRVCRRDVPLPGCFNRREPDTDRMVERSPVTATSRPPAD